MTISGNVPSHLLVAARTGFLVTAMPSVPAYSQIAATLNMTTKSQTLTDVGAAPMPLRSRGRGNRRAFIEKVMTVTPLDWEIFVTISHNAVKDDQTGDLERKARSAGQNFQRHMALLAFQALNDGDATTNFGAAYDGGAFYANSHVDKGAEYTTGQDNLYALALSLDNFETVRVAAKAFKDDQGEETDYNYNLLVVPPGSERLAANITQNPQDYATANRAANPYAGNTSFVVSPKLDTTAWILVASGETVKPIIVAIREMPNLQASWFDPDGADGGMYTFKFYARYNHVYGDWRLAIMGRT